MNVIYRSNQNTINELGGFQIKTKCKKYRLNKYLVECECNDGIIIYNCFTGSEILIKPYEYVNIFTEYPCDYQDFLISNYFIIPEDFDEEWWVQRIKSRQVTPITSTFLDHPNHFTILTTTTCNARCFYCYEKDYQHKRLMSSEVMEDVAKYIIDYADKKDVVTLDWFGGEPLVNQKAIDTITSRVASAGMEYVSTMISNGYLFNEELIDKAIGFWKLKTIQITLDGPEQSYNSIKNYIYKNTNPYQIVKDNIRILLNKGVDVSIRMNCGPYNFEEIKALVLELNKDFKGYNNFNMYAHEIFEEGFIRTDEENKQLYQNLKEIDKLVNSGGWDLVHGLMHSIKGKHCMADSGNSVVINPEGKISVCEHYVTNHFVSDIYNPLDRNFEELKEWQNYTKPIEICKNCPLLPECLRLKNCPDEKCCNEYQKDYEIEHYKLCMLKDWEKCLNNNGDALDMIKDSNVCCNLNN